VVRVCDGRGGAGVYIEGLGLQEGLGFRADSESMARGAPVLGPDSVQRWK
jgi:hypothetical protein